MKYWQRIRKERTDLTDYIIHWTKGKNEGGKWTKPFDTLLKIIECGYLVATFAKKSSIYDRTGRPTVRGPYPSVCFTEQSLDSFALSCNILPTHYKPYGIALYKRALYKYGGRPVIYHSEEILGQMLMPNEKGYKAGQEIFKNGLPDKYQYLWVRYEPIPNEDGYVVDWTHEREWRSKVEIIHDIELGVTPDEGVPILLPAIYDSDKGKHIRYLPKILVSTIDEKEIVIEMIRILSPDWSAKSNNKYLQGYFKLLPKVNVIALGELNEQPEAHNLEWIIPDTN